MTTAEFIRSLLAADVRIRLEADKVRVSAPQGRLTPELQRALAERKQEIQQFLSTHGPIEDAPREAPASSAQQRFWFLDQLEPGNNAYNLGAVKEVLGPIDAGMLEASINDVIRRQDSLRTVFREQDGAVHQVVQPFEQMPLKRIDLTHLSTRERDAELPRVRRAEAAGAFDLAKGPLVRATLVALEPERHELLVTVHHIISDNWSLGIFFEELTAHYQARAQKRDAGLAPLSTQYADFSTQEHARLQGADFERLVEDWASRLRGAPPTIDLITDRPRPPRQTFNGSHISFTLPADLSRALHALAKSERASLYMTLLAVFNVLLHRYSGQADLVIGTPFANRDSSALERLIGLFVSTLPIRTTIAPDATVRSLIAQTREAVLDAQTGKDLPFEKLVEKLRPERSAAHSPIFQIIFALQSTPLNATFDVSTVASMFDLSLFMWDSPDTVRGVFEFNTDIFNAETIGRMRDHFLALCAACVAAPDTQVARLSMLDEKERQQIARWSAAPATYPRDGSISQVFEERASRTPDVIALETTDEKREVFPRSRLTYRELSQASGALASRLITLGITQGEPVALYLDRSVAAIVTILALLKAGAAYVPLSSDPPRARTIDVLRSAGVRHVLCSTAGARKFSAFDLPVIDVEKEWSRSTSETPSALPVASGPESLAYLMFTSGTTGMPKGVCVTHRNVLRLVCNPNYVHLGPEERILQFAPLPFDASTFEIWGALLNGARLVVCPDQVPSAKEFAEVLDTRRITTLWLTAGFFHYIVENECASLSRVRQVLAGGDVLSVTHVQKLLDLKREGVVINGYGPTENTTFTCCHPMLPQSQVGASVPIGKPIANTAVYILDSSGAPVPTGVPGELCAGGDGVAKGYVNDAALSAKRFVPDPFSERPGATMYRTGDRVRWRPDGTIEFLGRADLQVKVRGFRIEIEEIEHALRESPLVRDAAVVAQKDSSGTNVLIAYLVPAASVVEASEIRRFLSERLHEYMIPSAFITVDALPLTQNGKVDRKALPALKVVRREPMIEPRNHVETQLLAIWQGVLGRTDFGVRDNFFELGGHSLLAVRMFALIDRVLGHKLPVSALFQAANIERLAQRLEREGFRSPWDSLVAIQPQGVHTPLFLVPGIGGNVFCYADLGRLLGKDRPIYALQSRGLDGRSDPFKRIEPMAAHYISEIRKAQPHGPYHLGGACFGGAVVWEMAQQLRAAGEQVGCVFLLETWPAPPRRRIAYGVARGIRYLRFVGSIIKQNLRELIREPSGNLWQRLREHTSAAKQSLMGQDDTTGDLAALYMDRISLANYESFTTYRPGPYEGFVMLVMATERKFVLVGRDPRFEWADMVRGECVVRGIPATDSGKLVALPHATALSHVMREGIALGDAYLKREPASAAQSPQAVG